MEEAAAEVEFGALTLEVRAGDEFVSDASCEFTRFNDLGTSIVVSEHWPLVLDPAQGCYRTRIENLEPGLYAACTHPWSQVARGRVTRGGESTIVLDPARRISAVMQVVDAATGAVLPESRVLFANVLSNEQSSCLFATEERDASGTGWSILVEPGSIDLVTSATGYASERRRYEVSAAEPTLSIALRKLTDFPIVLNFRSGGTQPGISVDDWREVAIHSGPPGGLLVRQEFPGFEPGRAVALSVLRVSVPGVYVLRIPVALRGNAGDELAQVHVTDPEGGRITLQRQE